jgi:hypothetical protein
MAFSAEALFLPFAVEQLGTERRILKDLFRCFP